jgi:hypothetical protein
MFAAGVVESVDVVKEDIADVGTGCPNVSPDQFGLYGLEEGFNGGIVIPISFATHRYLEA